MSGLLDVMYGAGSDAQLARSLGVDEVCVMSTAGNAVMLIARIGMCTSQAPVDIGELLRMTPQTMRELVDGLLAKLAVVVRDYADRWSALNPIGDVALVTSSSSSIEISGGSCPRDRFDAIAEEMEDL